MPCVGSSVPSDKPRVNLVVEPETKERWEQEGVESGKFSSLAELVRVSVNRELDGFHESTGGVRTPENVEARLSDDARAQLSRMESALEDVSDSVNRLEQKESRESPEYDFKKVLYHLLPEAPADGVSPSMLASRIGADTDVVEGHLYQLYEQTSGVVATTIDGEAHYRLARRD